MKTPSLLLSLSLAAALHAAETETKTSLSPPHGPAAAVDGASIVFNPQSWQEHKISTQLYPWPGQNIVFLTTRADLDPTAMARFVEKLDAGWRIYGDLVGKSPKLFKQWDQKPTLVAVPSGDLTCGVGCGYIGVTGIELAKFYQEDYPMVAADEKAFPHYCFYEMGRNYYLFGDRHSSFITGYAVFMRYVCMDGAGCSDPESHIRQKIEEAEERFAKSDMDFLKGFTMQGGLGEKAPRLKGEDGAWLQPSDQPVVYASAMLKLRRDNGGDAWVKRFFAELMKCPEVKVTDSASALRQSMNWIVAASCAARKDLSGVFVERWRFPMAPKDRQTFASIHWEDDHIDATAVMAALNRTE